MPSLFPFVLLAFADGSAIGQIVRIGWKRYGGFTAEFSPSIPHGSVLGAVPIGDACGAAPPQGTISGQIAVASRGNCTFSQKERWAAAAGAVALLVLSNETAFPMVGDDSVPKTERLPTVMVGAEAAADLASPTDVEFQDYVSGIGLGEIALWVLAVSTAGCASMYSTADARKSRLWPTLAEEDLLQLETSFTYFFWGVRPWRSSCFSTSSITLSTCFLPSSSWALALVSWRSSDRFCRCAAHGKRWRRGSWRSLLLLRSSRRCEIPGGIGYFRTRLQSR
jgi:signal peptide peptidase-like protein 2B